MVIGGTISGGTGKGASFFDWKTEKFFKVPGEEGSHAR